MSIKAKVTCCKAGIIEKSFNGWKCEPGMLEVEIPGKKLLVEALEEKCSALQAKTRYRSG